MIKQFFVCTIIFFSFFLSKAQTFKWAQKIGGTSSDFARSIATDNNGNTFIIGGFNGTLIFPGTGSLASRSLVSLGQKDIYPWYRCITPLVADNDTHIAEKIKLIPDLIKIK